MPVPVIAPNLLAKLLETQSPEMRLKIREAVERLHIVNPDDPIFELMLVLGLWGTYYQKIPGQVTQAGQDIKRQNAEALESLDERVRMLQGLAQAIHQATDRLTYAGKEIVEGFPVAEIARQITARVDNEIKTLPLKDFEKSVDQAKQTMELCGSTAQSSAQKLQTGVQRVEEAAQQINQLKLPPISFWWTVLWLVIGAAGPLFFWWFTVRKNLDRMNYILDQHAYFEDRAWVSAGPNGGSIITVPKENVQATGYDKQGNAVIQLNK